MNAVSLQLHVLAPDPVEAAFGGELTPGASARAADGLTLAIVAADDRPGLNRRELLLSIALNMATGVTSGVAANWIWHQFQLADRDNVVATADGTRDLRSAQELAHYLDQARQQRGQGNTAPTPDSAAHRER